MRRSASFAVHAAVLTLLLGLALSRGVAQAASGSLLPGATLYPRVVRLEHGPAATRGRLIASTNTILFESTDEGASWTRLGKVPVVAGSRERCCATLFEVPVTIGELAAGTLISAGSYFSGATPAIELYTSTDQGHTWTYRSTPVKAGSAKHGLWEPEFSIAKDGALVMFWSDETDPCCSQKLAQMRTYDGRSWKDRKDTVASPQQRGRPGMAVVSRMPYGTYFMSYEVCGTESCKVFSRTSQDGWNFGKASDLGTEVVTAAGEYLEHAPWNVFLPLHGAPGGAILLVGQVFYRADGTVSPRNGEVLLVNTDPAAAGPWTVVAAPVKVPKAYDNFCPNYSSALRPSVDGSTLLELASAYNSDHQCRTYFATEPWSDLASKPATPATD